MKFIESKSDYIKTHTFNKWFTGSKVVDTNGEPLVLYHGGPKFRGDFIIPDDDDNGIYFTDNYYFALHFAAYAEINARDKNDFDYDGIPENILEGETEWEEKYFKYAEVKKVYLKMLNPKIVDAIDAKLIPSQYDSRYDGFIARTTGDFGYKGGQYVVFDNSQIWVL